MPADLVRLRENLEVVRDKIAAAAKRAGRKADDIKLVAVTKYVDANLARALADLGLHDLGESRPQELWKKAEALADLPIRWHLVGHLQRNKLRRTLPLVTLLHSADSERLLQAIHEEARQQGRTTDLLLEINISGEPSKTGMLASDARSLMASRADWPQIRVRGLMGMASLEGDLADNRREFAALRTLRDELRKLVPTHTEFNELSMGMSGDYEVAIEEGATLVRVGSALFEGVA
jgi:pyridoxal phosphate enzyme (YggS family)